MRARAHTHTTDPYTHKDEVCVILERLKKKNKLTRISLSKTGALSSLFTKQHIGFRLGGWRHRCLPFLSLCFFLFFFRCDVEVAVVDDGGDSPPLPLPPIYLSGLPLSPFSRFVPGHGRTIGCGNLWPDGLSEWWSSTPVFLVGGFRLLCLTDSGRSALIGWRFLAMGEVLFWWVGRQLGGGWWFDGWVVDGRCG